MNLTETLSEEYPAQSVTITGLGPTPSATVPRALCFPALRISTRPYSCPNLPGWAPNPIPIGGSNLHLELLDLISMGASSVVYSARVLQDGLTRAHNVPDEVCIKIAKPSRCRSLARDAWFYEQLAK